MGPREHRAQLGYSYVGESRARTGDHQYLPSDPPSIYSECRPTIGTSVALSWFWLIATALAGVYFVYAATVEERYLAGQFPDTYPAYKRSTKMLVPYVF